MMRLLLDTHVLIWWLAGNPRLDGKAQAAIQDSTNAVFVSAVAGFEIASKKASGKLKAPADLVEQVEANGFAELPVTLAHGFEAGLLPLHHKDPFDRLLVAQARAEDLTLVTSDRVLAAYPVRTMSAG